MCLLAFLQQTALHFLSSGDSRYILCRRRRFAKKSSTGCEAVAYLNCGYSYPVCSSIIFKGIAKGFHIPSPRTHILPNHFVCEWKHWIAFYCISDFWLHGIEYKHCYFSCWLFSLNFGQTLVTGKIGEHAQSGPAVEEMMMMMMMMIASKAVQTSKAALETPLLKNPGGHIWLRMDLSWPRLLPYLQSDVHRAKGMLLLVTIVPWVTKAPNTGLMEFVALGGIVNLFFWILSFAES